MNNTDASLKLDEFIEEVENERMEPIEYEIMDIDRQLVIHVEFPTKTNQNNIIFPRKFFKRVKEEIGLELLSFEMISPDKDSVRRIDYINNAWIPFPSIEIVFENPDIEDKDIEKLYVTEFGAAQMMKYDKNE